MKTPEEYLELHEQCRRARIGAQDEFMRKQFEAFERSYFALAHSGQLLASASMMQAASKREE